MIICSCAVISSSDIDKAVAWMKAAEPQVVVTPGKVYRALGKKPVCGGCASLFVAAVHKPDQADVPAELRNIRMALKETAANDAEKHRAISG